MWIDPREDLLQAKYYQGRLFDAGPAGLIPGCWCPAAAFSFLSAAAGRRPVNEKGF
jgi:hypothetical protein